MGLLQVLFFEIVPEESIDLCEASNDMHEANAISRCIAIAKV